MKAESLQICGVEFNMESSSAKAGPLTSQDDYIRVDLSEVSAFKKIERSLLVRGDAKDALGLLPAESVQTVVTSPPYWSLRDYDVADQIGCDDFLPDYLDSIVQTFEEIKRVLRNDGTVWLNVGDSYTSGNRSYRAPDRKNRARAMRVRPSTPEGLKPKDLIEHRIIQS